MNKAQLSQTMAAKLTCKQEEAENLLTTILQQIQTALVEGEKIYLTNFGTFELRYCLAKSSDSNDSDNQAFIPLTLGYNKPAFKASNSLKLALN